MPNTSSDFRGGRWPSIPFEGFAPATIYFPHLNIPEIKQVANPGKTGSIDHDKLR